MGTIVNHLGISKNIHLGNWKSVGPYFKNVKNILLRQTVKIELDKTIPKVNSLIFFQLI